MLRRRLGCAHNNWKSLKRGVSTAGLFDGSFGGSLLFVPRLRPPSLLIKTRAWSAFLFFGSFPSLLSLATAVKTLLNHPLSSPNSDSTTLSCGSKAPNTSITMFEEDCSSRLPGYASSSTTWAVSSTFCLGEPGTSRSMGKGVALFSYSTILKKQ